MSIFKTSCFVFWLVWMSTLSFLFGTKYIQSRYSYLDDEETSGVLMTAACIATVSMAVLGCCCVKFDVTHICCAFWYVGLTFFGIVIICILIMNALKSSSSGTLLNEVELLQKVIKEYKARTKVPYFLYHTQMAYECCGIVGFKDYRAFIISGGISQDVPFSCCRQPLFGLDDRPYCNDVDTGELFDPTNLYLNMTTTKPLPEKLDEDMNKAYGQLQEYYGDLTATINYTNQDFTLPVNVSKARSINLKGCYEHLRTNSQDLHDTYFKFCLILMASAALMAILYIRNCIQARRVRLDRLKEMIETSASTSLLPKVTTVSGDLSDEEQQQILHDLTYVKRNKTSVDHSGPLRPDHAKRASTGGSGGPAAPAIIPPPGATKRRV